MDQRPGGIRPGSWTGYAAAVWAFIFAVPSFLWGSGINVGVRSVGRDLVSYTWSNHAGSLVFVLLTGCLKVVGGLFALALVRPLWPLPNRRLTLVGGYVAAGFLVVYGLQDVILPLLVETHVISAGGDPDWFAIRWHMLLWGPYFAAWGVLLGLAVRCYQRAPRGRQLAGTALEGLTGDDARA